MHDADGEELERNAASARAELDYLGLILADLKRGMDVTSETADRIVGLPLDLLKLPFTPETADLTLTIAERGVRAMHGLTAIAKLIDGLSELIAGRIKMVAEELGVELVDDEAESGDAA